MNTLQLISRKVENVSGERAEISHGKMCARKHARGRTTAGSARETWTVPGEWQTDSKFTAELTGKNQLGGWLATASPASLQLLVVGGLRSLDPES